jgi:hypothetical protein
MPCRLAFHTTDDKSYITIFKHGDDLRQDQLMLQMFTLMDRVGLLYIFQTYLKCFCNEKKAKYMVLHV